ncbi:MAG: NAD(P)-binding domain-containing protein, partial [Nitrospiraceae bacterium]|nr:NAD(P)-binding domain-containing protein [Nitrospiraceae bacterium]
MEQTKLVVVGAGPAGIATAVEAKEAKIAPVVVLEKTDHICATIERLYPPGKRVDPVHLKIKLKPIGKLSFDTESKEDFIERMANITKENNIDIRYKNGVQCITASKKKFYISTGGGLEIQTPLVVIAIGIFGRPVKPRYPIPKEIRQNVHFSLPKAPLKGKKVLIVGGGNSAAEAASLLSKDNEVSLSYRRPEFFRLNEINASNIKKYAKNDTINLMMATDIEALEGQGDKIIVNFKNGKNIEYDVIFYCLGGMTPKVFLEKIGIKINKGRPLIDEYGESNIPRLFLAGDLAIRKGTIMAAFNSGKKVIDGILARYAN